MMAVRLVLRQWASVARTAACVVVAALPIGAASQGLRDPTLAPSAVQQGPGGAGAGEKATAPASMAVIVRDGRPYVVAGTRLVAQGQMLGDARVERISETEIWLREGKTLRKIPRFAGVQRKALP